MIQTQTAIFQSPYFEPPSVSATTCYIYIYTPTQGPSSKWEAAALNIWSWWSFTSGNTGALLCLLPWSARAANTKHHSLGVLSNMYFLIVLESQIRVWQGRCLVRALFLACRLLPSCCFVLTGWRGWEWAHDPVYKDANLIGSGPHPYDLI